MKKRMISLLLCTVMLIGLMPMNILTAEAAYIVPPIHPEDTYEGDTSWTDSTANIVYGCRIYRDVFDEYSLYAELTGVSIDSEDGEIEWSIPYTFSYTPVEGKEEDVPLRAISGKVLEGENVSSISSISIPASVEIIGANAFKNLANLATVTFREGSNGENSLKTIGDSAFSGCVSLMTCVLPETVEAIGSEAFYGTALTSVKFGAALKTLGESAFANCENLAELDMNEVTGLEAIPDSCFSSHALTALTIPDSVKTIGDWAFHTYESNPPLASLTLGEGVETIGEYAFGGNENLTGKLILPDSVSTIGKSAFASCGYSEVKWPQNNGDFTVVNGFSGCANLTGAAIADLPFSVTTIGEEAFSDCSDLGGVAIPGFIKTIKSKAFSGAGITSLTIANGVEIIEKNAFQGCVDLLGTEITIPASVTTLASGAFSELYTMNGTEDEPLTVKVLNPDLILDDATNDYLYWAADDEEHKTDLYTGDAFGSCVNLILYAPAGNSKAKAYAEKFHGATIRSWKEAGGFQDFSRTVVFRELTDVPVYHTITLPTASDVTFTVRQNGVALPVNGNTVQAVSGTEVVVTAHREGYFDQVAARRDVDFTADWTVVLGEWRELPVNNRMLVRITKDDLPLNSFDGLNLSLKHNGSDVSFIASFPYLVLDENQGLDATASLTLTVTPDASMQLTAGSAAATPQSGIFTVELKGWGTAAVKAEGTSAVPCVVILFDDSGNAVSSGFTSGGVFTTDPLPEGQYTVVAYEANDYFGAVGSEDALAVLGLTDGDYAKGTVIVTDGGSAELTLAVPRLNIGGLTTVLDAGKCSMAFRASRVATGQTFDMRLNYGLKTGTAQKINFTLPEGAVIQSVYNDQGPLTVDTNNSVAVNNASGTLYVPLICSGNGIKSFGASVTTGGTTLPLSGGTVTVQNIFIDGADSYTAKKEDNRVSIYTAPNESVTLTISGEEQTVTAKANAAGRATLTFSLPDDAAYGQSYTITVTSNGGSDKTTMTYLPDSAELRWFGFTHNGYEITVIDNIDPNNEQKYYTYYALGDEKSKYFYLYATFKADQDLNVTATVTMQDGSVHSVPMKQFMENGELKQYGGELFLEGNAFDHVFHEGSIPVSFEIDWDNIAAPEPEKQDIYEQALEQAKERQVIREQALGALDLATVRLTNDVLTRQLLEIYAQFLNGYQGSEEVKQQEKKAIEDNISEVVQLFGSTYGDPYTFILFGYKYRMSDTELFQRGMMTRDEYDSLVEIVENSSGSTETKADQIQGLTDLYNYGAEFLAMARETEAMIDDAAEQVTGCLGLEDPIQNYGSWEEIMAEKGVEYSECEYTVQELEAQGYTQVEDNSGSYWVKEGDDGKMSAFWAEGSGTEGGTGGSDQTALQGALLTLDSVKEAVSGNIEDWQRSVTANGLGFIGESVIKEAEYSLDVVKTARESLYRRYPGDAMADLRTRVASTLDAQETCAMGKLKDGVAIKSAGQILSVYNVYVDQGQLTQNMIDTSEYKAKMSELEPLIRYATIYDNWKCVNALWAERDAYFDLTQEMNLKTNHLGINVAMGSFFTLADVFSYGQASKAGPLYDLASGARMGIRDFDIAQLKKKVEQLHAKRVAICGDDWRKMPKRTLTPILDPSGIVYEAVESNVLSGVEAAIYDVSGNSAVLWNAADYDQTNPLKTGADGSYAWDVPTGTWQVRFTKDGYQNAATENLIVPPPRMNLKTAMEAIAAPEVISAAAYPDYVELVFSQYMRVTDELTVPDGYTCEWVNKEKVNAESSTEYSKVLHLKKSASVGETVAVTLSGAKNYVGTALAAYASGPLTVVVEPFELRLNYETQIAVLVGEAKDPRVTVQVLDRNGQPLAGLTVNAAIADTTRAEITAVQADTDRNGIATFSVKSLLPGWTEVTFSVNGSGLARTMPLRVSVATNQVEKLVASIGGNDYTASTNNITVARGSVLTLTCATEDAVIYYTTNDTCPCQAVDRQLYTGPITVNEDTYFRIVAYKDGMEYSERLNLKVSVSKSSSGGGGGSSVIPEPSVPEDNSTMNVFVDVPATAYYYDAVSWAANNGITGGTSATTFSPNAPCTRAQIVTFLWKAAGSPEPEGTQSFDDVASGAYYEKAVAWAAENGITGGTGNGKFSPNATCTRAQAVAFLYRACNGSAVSSGTEFTDVKPDAYYAEAVAWAAENGITSGVGGGLFGPNLNCTRAQIVTFLYHAYQGR